METPKTDLSSSWLEQERIELITRTEWNARMLRTTLFAAGLRFFLSGFIALILGLGIVLFINSQYLGSIWGYWRDPDVFAMDGLVDCTNEWSDNEFEFDSLSRANECFDLSSMSHYGQYGVTVALNETSANQYFGLIVLVVLLLAWTISTLSLNNSRFRWQSMTLDLLQRVQQNLIHPAYERMYQPRADLARDMREYATNPLSHLALRKQHFEPTIVMNQVLEAEHHIAKTLEPDTVLRIDVARNDEALRMKARELQINLRERTWDALHAAESVRVTQIHEQWMATQREVTELRKVMTAAHVEMLNNPAISQQLNSLVDSMTQFAETMNRLKQQGVLSNSPFGQAFDGLMTDAFADLITSRQHAGGGFTFVRPKAEPAD